MAIRDKSVTIPSGKLVQLHLSVAKQCTVEIREPRDTLTLTRRLNAVNFQLTADRNFSALKTRQTIPWGTIGAVGPAGLTILYRVRSGSDVLAAPEFQFED